MTLFAGQLDGAVSLGDALRNAKQQYFGSQGLYGAYDEKALSSTILYGLPMFAVGTERPVRPTPPNETTAPGAGTVGLSSTPYSQDFTFAPKSGDIGRWYEADTGTGPQLPQITASRPVSSRVPNSTSPRRPLTTRCCRPTARWSSGLRTGQVVADFDAAFSRPTLDNAAGEPEAVNSVAAFPTRLAGVTTVERHPRPRRTGRRRPTSEARADARSVPVHRTRTIPNGRGTQVLYDRMSGDVYYSGVDRLDRTEGRRGRAATRSAGDTFADVSVSASDASGHPPRRRPVPGRR